MKKLLNALAKPGAGAFDSLIEGLKAIWLLMVKPGRKWLESESIGKQLGGAFWCAFMGYTIPMSIYKIIIGAVFAHNVLFAWL